MAVPGWFWQHLPFFVLALILPAQMILRVYTVPDRDFATENVSRAFDQAVNRAEDAALSLAHLLESWGVSRATVDRIPFLHREKLLLKAPTQVKIGPLELDLSDTRRALHRHQFVLVNFYAPWCVHCRAFEPAYQTIAERLHNDPSLDILVGRVDGTKHKRLLDRHEIDAYPSVLLYSHGDLDNPVQYVDVRDPDMIVCRADPHDDAPMSTISSRSVDAIALEALCMNGPIPVQWVNSQIQKLSAGGAVEPSYFGKSTRPKWRLKKVLYRVGDVVRDETAPPGTGKKGIIIGWDYYAHGPPEWLRNVDPALVDVPHYRVLWDASAPGLEENPSYVPQTTLRLVLDTDEAVVQHPSLADYVNMRHDTHTYEPAQKLRILYPDD